VAFHGVVTDVSAVWRTIGLLAMPSRAEGVPLAALEAMASGVPVLASRVGGLPTAIREGETGWLHPVGDLARAEAAVRDWAALDPAAQAELRRLCRDHAAAAFGEEAQFPRILAVYRACGLAIPD
jgi:glycosyltransferase involved in cell wall biosynthesis